MAAANQREVRILPDAKSITRWAENEIATIAADFVKTKGSFNIVLSGGSTPKALYEALADDAAYRSRIPWDKVFFFFGDERHVPPDHAESNYRMANEALFSKLSLRPEQVERIHGEYPDTEKAALEYEQVLRAYFKVSDGEYPRFDLVLL